MTSVLRPLPDLAAALERREITSVEIVEDSLARIAERNDDLNAFLAVDRPGALAAATASDVRRARGEARGLLDGIPFAIKDNIVARGLPTTCGSRILERYVSPWDAEVVERLLAAGAVLLGKVNLDEFAMGSSNETSAFGPVRNPHALDRVPGGSSGGSCAAVASGMAPLALGSSTGGSIRLPASYCGVVGVKPTYGRVSRRGLVAFGSSLDQIGPIARTVEGVAVALAAISGFDPADATSLDRPVPDWRAELGRGVGGMRLGVVREFLGEGIDAGIRRRVESALERLAAAGAEIIEVTMPHTRWAVAAYYVVASAEASSNLARYDGIRYGHRAAHPVDLEDLYERSRSEGFGDEVKRRLMIGTFALSAGYHDAYYGRAMRARDLVRRDYAEAFARVDALLSPISPVPPFPLAERTGDPLAMYLVDALTVPANLAGVPAMSVPLPPLAAGAGRAAPATAGDDPPDGPGARLPAGLQIQAPWLEEGRLFRVAAAWEALAGPADPPAARSRAGEGGAP